jgi:hypothetical protein
MTTENLVTIDFDSELVHNNNEIDENSEKNIQEIDSEIVLFGDNSILEDVDSLHNESQPLLGGDHHDHITYNQFPGKTKTFPRFRVFFLSVIRENL